MNHPSLAAFPLLDTLRLIRSENVGPVTFFSLMKRFESPARALEAIADMSLKGGRGQPISVCSRSAAEQEMERTQKFGAQMLVFGSANYPSLLHSIYDPPPVLIAKGNPALWRERALVAIVGARNASANGCHFAQKLAQDLSKHHVISISGLARGIDAAVHRATLASGTVAVIAGGIDHIYPPEHTALYHEIAECGAILSENPFGAAPQARHFPGRNRIISGMALGVIVIEASLKSGSLITARYALEQNRDVFAVPGSPLDPRCKGSNDLIRQGATLTESIEDVLPTITRLREHHLHEGDAPHYAAAPLREPDETELKDARRVLLQKLSPEAVDIDTLLLATELPATVLLTILLELELAGRVSRGPGNTVSLLYHDASKTG